MHPLHQKILAPLCTVALALLAPAAQAQELRLFEPIEGEAAAVPVPDQGFVPQANGQPAYTLRSVSRVGDQYHAVLIDRSGQVIKVSWKEGESPALPNSGFNLVSTGSSSSVALQHPLGDNCVSAELLGVRCAAANRSELHLAVAAPLASNGVPPPAMMTGAQGFVDNGNPGMGPNAPAAYVNDGVVGVFPPGVNGAQNGQQVFINPFSGEPEVMPQVSPEELAQRQQRQGLRAARLQQFEQQQRINDADIPPGMQRVRTPFGDSLMPIRE